MGDQDLSCTIHLQEVWWYVQWFLFQSADIHTHIRTEPINALLPRLRRRWVKWVLSFSKNWTKLWQYLVALQSHGHPGVFVFEEFEMKSLQQVLRVSKTNSWVMETAGVERDLLKSVKRRKMAYFGHIMRKDGECLEKEITQGTTAGSRGRGRPKMLQNICKTFLHVF